MKIALRCVLIIALAALPFAAGAGDLEESLGEDFSLDFAGAFEMGGWGADAQDSPDKVSEFEPDDGSPTLVFLADSHNDWGSLFVDYDYNHKRDNSGSLNFDLQRMVRSHTSYNKFMHRFGHDRMKNLEAGSLNGKVIHHTDFDPNAEYEIDYSLLEHRTEFQFPALSALTLAFEYRNQQRNGHSQAYTTSHCDSCHVKSQSHKVKERTIDAKLEAGVAFNGGTLKGSWNHRTLTHKYNSVTTTFADAVHPELRVPVFDNRMQYDSDIGPVPADLWPDQEKSTGRLDLNFHNLGGFAVNLGGVYQDSKNDYTGYRAKYQGAMLNAAKLVGKKMRIRLRARAYSLNNDNVWIDVNDQPADAGPHAGLTYEDWTGENLDHWRKSVMDRNVYEADLDLSYRVSKTAGTFRFRWDYEATKREHYEVLPDEGTTTENIFGVYWRARPIKGLKIQAHLKHGDISNPFMLINGACSTLVSGSSSNPWDPDVTDQYYEFQDARIAETTASAEGFDEFKLGGTFKLGSSSTLSATYRYWDGDNQAGDLTNWSRTNQNLTATLWSAPTSEWNWYLGYAYSDTELNAPVCIPIFDG
ncbi:MAG: hypothetical protein K8R59_04465 [Thermoanaerobaculales bacterium]|nr:hypothetical protein [Thermoanaerobaculales bacterium]